MKGKVLIIISVILLFVIFGFAHSAPAADYNSPTVGILSPMHGTSASPTIISNSPTVGGVKVEVQVWDDETITGVNVGYCQGADPDACSWTWTSATVNSNYDCDTGCGFYNATLSLAPGEYWIMANAVSTDGVGSTKDEKVKYDANNDPRYSFINVTATKEGTGTLLVRSNTSQFCIDCHGPGHAHSSQTTDTGYGNWGTICYDCHTPHGTTNLFLIRENILTPKNGVKAVTFRNTSVFNTPGGYVDGAAGASTQGVCQVCHTQLPRWTNQGPGDGHYYDEQCSSCHHHAEGFVGSGECATCHASVQSGYRRIVTGSTTGDIEPGLTTHHIQNTTAIAEATCKACHDQTNHKTYSNGVSVGIKNADTGAFIAYDGTPASLTPHCLSCHDDTGTINNTSTPFSDSGDNNNPFDVDGGHGNIDKGRSPACMVCHGNSGGVAGNTLNPKFNAHGSNSSFILNSPTSWGTGDCSNCHTASDTVFAEHSNHVVSMTIGCTSCHMVKPHGGQSARAEAAGFNRAMLITEVVANVPSGFLGTTSVSGDGTGACTKYTPNMPTTACYAYVDNLSQSGSWAVEDCSPNNGPNTSAPHY